MHFKYWGKRTRGEDGRWHHLCHHGLDVAAVVEALLRENATWRTRLFALSPYGDEQTRALLFFLAASHDLGKFADGFQFCLPEEMVWNPPLGRDWRHHHRAHHTTLGLDIWYEIEPHGFLPLPDEYVLEPLLTAALAHHGEPCEAAEQSPWHVQDERAVQADIQEYLTECAMLFGLAEFPEADEQALNRFSFVAAGLFILADWIASNGRWFAMDDDWLGAAPYFPKAQECAKRALEELDFLKDVAPGEASDFHELLPHLAGCAPSAMQQAVLDLPPPAGPELLILEDLTGGGKTEAALLAAHRFLRHHQGSALYIGLPTMATADAMYGRMDANHQTLFAEPVSLMLAHGGRALNRDFRDSILPDAGDGQEAGGAFCAQWLADNRKKALLAPCGVGTIDQALLAILKTRHQALRLFGLCRSVFVGDEVHAFDAYTGTLLQTLLTFHAAMGGSAILLSATLPQRLRQDFVNAWRKGRACYGEAPKAAALQSAEFPLLTQVTDNSLEEQAVPGPPAETRKEYVQVRLVHEEAAMYKALVEAAKAGACACWIRNTVGDVREAWRTLTEEYGVPPDKVLVFHARFTGLDRRNIEQEVLRHFDKRSTPELRAGWIVLASQVVEQSLDLDFDLLLTDLAPMDLLIQRAGRCHRHAREQRPEAYAHPLMQVLSPPPADDAGANWYAEMFKGGQYVYSRHALLWRTARLLEMEGCLRLPQRARFLIERADGNEGIFPDEPQVVAPDTLDDREFKADGEDSARKSEAHFNELRLDAGYLPEGAWADDARAPSTRLGEATQQVRLIRQSADGLRLWAEGKAQDDMEACLLSELRVPMRALREACNPPEWTQALAGLRDTRMPDKGRWCLCLIVREENGLWVGQGQQENGTAVTVRYNARFGLEIVRSGSSRAEE
ncbi:MAG: CRISPR-associated helicase Cas3' [Rhodocyclaceae bacterium]|nr:CRISPR-associated helicase Cas3' [Rhodocyclaceae bacterium]